MGDEAIRLVRQELGIPGDFPDMLIGILEIASIASIEGLLCRFDNRGPSGFGLLHHQVNFFFAADIVSQGKVRRTGSLNRQVSIVSDACAWPQSQLDPVLKLKEDHRSILKFLPDDPLCWQTETVSIEAQRPVQIIDAQGNDRNVWFHGGTFPFLIIPVWGPWLPRGRCASAEAKGRPAGQRVCPGGDLLDSYSIPPKGVSSEVQCLSRHLTVRSSRTPPSRSSLRFQPSRRFANSPSLKRQEAPIMRFKSQIPAEANREEVAVISAEVSRTGHVQGRRS